ncbi:MAG: dihydroorotase [Oscillospiraceae bacterium]|jgi:dihydroorotase|nr:dihydroorotase [Oscillospiraceae bacterium]
MLIIHAKDKEIYIKNGLISEPFLPDSDTREIDARGLLALPGLCDVHVHFRDPGFTHKEDILSGARAAASGGVTTCLCMPNTSPATDSPETVRYCLDKAKDAPIRVYPYGAATVGQKGEQLTDFTALKNAGAAAISDDGNPIQSAQVLLAALIASKNAGLVLAVHCEDANLVQNYAVNEGAVSRKLGLPGRPAVAEELQVDMSVRLAKHAGARVHICHVSTRGSVEIIRRAKAEGVAVTAETCPHYFTLTENAVLEKGSLARVNPPLRTQDDVEAIAEALRDGTIDCIATDHAPHNTEEKERPLPDAPSGMVGLETLLSLAYSELCQKRGFSVTQLQELLCYSPARIFGLPEPSLEPGSPADLCLFDTEKHWTLTEKDLYGKSKNTPFLGRKMTGRVEMTVCRGAVVFERQK